MPQPVASPFLGPAYQARSSNLAAQSAINIYLEMMETASGRKAPGAFYNTPGLDLMATIGSGPVSRFEIMSTAFMLAVSGNNLWQVNADFSTTLLGTLGGYTGQRITSINNGTQAAFMDGTNYWVVQNGVITRVALPFSGPFNSTYQDTFGLLLQSGTNQWWQTNSFDLSTVNALNFSSADAKPDNIVAIASLHREIFLFKQNNTEVWVDSGQSGFAFSRLEGVFLEVGCAAPYSAVKAGETLMWLGQTTQGDRAIYMLNGYQPVRISTHAIEFQLAKYSTVADAFAYSYSQEGHTFVVFTFPAGDTTWVYDATDSLSSKEHLWHQRSRFVAGIHHRHRGNCYGFFNGNHLVGDTLSGAIFNFNPNTLNDNGETVKRTRSWLADKQTGRTQRFNQLRIDMETGILVDPAANPQVILRWSDDGGHTWSNEQYQSAGKTGVTQPFVKFRRLGSLRRNSGYDRIFELSTTDQFKIAWIEAEIS